MFDISTFTKLSCIDGVGLITQDIINVSEVLKSMIDDGLDINMTPLNYNLQDVVNYIKLCQLRKINKIAVEPLNDELSVFERSYFESLESEITDEYRKLDPVGAIICISDFLNNEGITDSCAKYIVERISKYSNDIQGLRKILQVENDFTEQEEAKIRKANAWCCSAENSS